MTKQKLYAGLIAVILLCLAEITFALEKAGSYEALGKKRTVRVEYAAGKEAWADYVLAKSREFLAAATLYLGKSVPETSTLLIRGKDQVLFDLPGFAWSGMPIGGTNYGDRVELAYSLSEPGKPGLLYHELGHYWFGSAENDSSVNWLYEGIVSYLPLALQDAKLLHIDEATRYWIDAHWRDDGNYDAPLEHDVRGDPKDSSFSLFYAKCFRIQKVLAYYLGQAGYKSFLLSLLPKQKLSNAEILETLGKIKILDWKALLSGWVFGESYGPVSKSAVLDIDSDNLTGMEELGLRTDPLRADTDGDGLSDGAEVELGLDPLEPVNASLRGLYLAKAGVRIDGLDSDWEEKGRVLIPDASGDVQITGAAGSYPSGAFDIISVECAARETFFHILIRTKDAPVRAKGILFDCMLDTDGDFSPDREFAFRLERPEETWRYNAKDKTSLMGPEYRGALSECIELRVPLAELPSNFSLLVIIRDEKEAKNLDEGKVWFSLSLAELKAVERLALETDLRDSDNDHDGIPDRDEIALGLDPLKKDPPNLLAQYGPFIDGSAFDWNAVPFTKFTDKEGGSEGADFDWLGCYAREGQYYFIVTLKSSPQVLAGKSFHLLCDLDGDGKSDREFSFFLDSPEAPWIYEDTTGESRTSPTLRAAISSPGTAGSFCIEILVPAELLKGSSLHVYPILRNMKGAFNYDEFASWLLLEKP